MNLFSFLLGPSVRTLRQKFEAEVRKCKELDQQLLGEAAELRSAVRENIVVTMERARHVTKLKEEHDLVAKKGSGCEHPAVGAGQ